HGGGAMSGACPPHHRCPDRRWVSTVVLLLCFSAVVVVGMWWSDGGALRFGLSRKILFHGLSSSARRLRVMAAPPLFWVLVWSELCPVGF
ncbi:hypothetical protein A2U01_0058955, partial [Trifolium medium]|nr:hypothetical protein [Trifolium medium]